MKSGPKCRSCHRSNKLTEHHHEEDLQKVAGLDITINYTEYCLADESKEYYCSYRVELWVENQQSFLGEKRSYCLHANFVNSKFVAKCKKTIFAYILT
jgi:hypothetical protein